MNYIYLDLNVFDRLEKLEKLSLEETKPYQSIIEYLQSGTLTAVYSNAHIGDLIRADKNRPTGDTSVLEGHLRNISNLTNNQCMCLYGGKVDVTVDHRDIFEFFNASLSESNHTETSFMRLFDGTNDDENPELNTLVETLKKTLEVFAEIPITAEFEKTFEYYPLLQQMFPETFETKNIGNSFNDIMLMSESMNNNMYRDLKRMMNPNNINEFMKVLSPDQKMDKNELKQILSTIDIISEAKKYLPQTKTSDNPLYDKLTNLYSQTDFRGFNSDKNFENMIDDANHTFYAAHCLFFITEDTRCIYKAKEVYKQLQIGTQVFTPKEFFKYIEDRDL